MPQENIAKVVDYLQIFVESGSNITASGVIGSSISLKGAGFGSGTIVVQPTALDTTTGDETYDIEIELSADNSTFVKWGRITDAEIKAVGVGGRILKPVHNQGSTNTFKYMRLYLTAAGTTPIFNCKAWLSND